MECGWHNKAFWLCTLHSEHWPCCLLWHITRCYIKWEHNSVGTSPVSRPVAVCSHVLSLKLLDVFHPHQHITSLNISKAVPLQAWSGPECSTKSRFPDCMTTAQDVGKLVSLTHRPPLPSGNIPGTHFCQRLSRPQGHSAIGSIICQLKIPVIPFGIEPATIRFVAQHLNHWHHLIRWFILRLFLLVLFNKAVSC